MFGLPADFTALLRPFPPASRLPHLRIHSLAQAGRARCQVLKFFRYITNNEAQSRHEELFDAVFWIVETAALLAGTGILLVKHEGEWIPFLVIEYCWAMDNLRHNRE
jgi:hypothetical protein